MNVAMLALLTPPATAEFAAVIPGGIVALWACLVILFDVFHRSETSRDYLAYLSAIGMGVALVSIWTLWDNTLDGAVFHGMLYFDKFSLLASAICCVSGIIAVLLSPAYLRAHSMDRGEYYMLILFAVSGMIFMVQSADMLSFFIGLEVMSIPVYALAAFLRKDRRSAEAGMKYFILGAFSTGLLLYGIALVYGLTGTTNFEMVGTHLKTAFVASEGSAHIMIVFSWVLVLSGFAFKIAAAPFHIWTPDVYTGSPTPASGFMATGVKTAAFIAMIRVFAIAFGDGAFKGGFAGVGWLDALLLFAVFSMVLGNFVAITQNNVKRMLAYSSIAHAGYILVGVTAANSDPNFFLHNDAVLFYLATYSLGTLGAFGVLAYLGQKGQSAETYEDLSGMGIKYPILGLIMAICMFSSAGIPPTAGFLGKFYIFRSAVDVGSTTGEFSFIVVAIVGVLASVAGVYYYLRVLVHMYMKPASGSFESRPQSGATFALVICAIGTLYLGLFPGKAIDLSREAVVDFQGAPANVQKTLDAGQKLLDAKNTDAPAKAAPAPAKISAENIDIEAAKKNDVAKPAEVKPLRPNLRNIPNIRRVPKQNQGSTRPGHEGHNHP